MSSQKPLQSPNLSCLRQTRLETQNQDQSYKRRLDERLVSKFIKSKQGKAMFAFSDGSVVNGPFGAGGCAVSIVPLDPSQSGSIIESVPVG